MEPARRRDNSADLAAAFVGPGTKPLLSVGVAEPDLKGLVEGVGRDG
jgi:hypothetical protein